MEFLPRSFNPNKHLKEQFVSNLTGSSMLEISAFLTTVPILVLLRHSICSETLTDADTNEASLKKKDSAIVASKNLQAYLVTLVMDFLFIILPMLLLFTVLAKWIYVGTILLSLLLIFSIAVKRLNLFPRLPHVEGPNSFRTSISSYRVATCENCCRCLSHACLFWLLTSEYFQENLLRLRLMVLAWFLTLLLDRHVERISRRMCNLAYVTWVLAQNLQLLAILMLFDRVTGSKPSALERAFDRNLLASFLLANMLTGLVNLSVDTLFASSLAALLILIAYTCSLSVVIGIIDFYGVRLKFW